MVTMTETAAKKISELRLEEGKPEWGLRVRIVGGGCSGMSYELGWEDRQQPDDDIVEAHGIKVYIDRHSAPYLTGSEIDYVDNSMLGAFRDRPETRAEFMELIKTGRGLQI